MGSCNSHHEDDEWGVFRSKVGTKHDRVMAVVPYIDADTDKVRYRSKSFRLNVHTLEKAMELAKLARDEMKKAPDVQVYIKRKYPPANSKYRARGKYANKKNTSYPDITGVYLHITFRKSEAMCLGIVGYMGAHAKRIYKRCEEGTIEDALRDICQQRTDDLGILFPSDEAISKTVQLMEKKVKEAVPRARKK